MPDGDTLAIYYAQRAGEFEQVYARPERQVDLARLRARLCALLAGTRVLEVACGTGYWTQDVARVAAHVTATDVGAEVLALARAKGFDPARVTLAQADAYDLRTVAGEFSAGLAAFWVSHVPRQALRGLLLGLRARLQPGARVVLCDNTFVPGSSTPLTRRDAHGNTYQQRTLASGQTYEVMKNYLCVDELAAAAGTVDAWEHATLGAFWLAAYRLPK